LEYATHTTQLNWWENNC